jgi:hypothetical protein
MKTKSCTELYATFILPGDWMMHDKKTCKVKTRDIKDLVLPKNCFGFYFFDQTVVKVGKEVLKGEERNKSNIYHIGSEVFDLERMKAEHPEMRSLIANMESWKWKAVVLCHTGHWQAMEGEDVALPPSDFKFSDK